MPIPNASQTNPILYDERKVWIKGGGIDPVTGWYQPFFGSSIGALCSAKVFRMTTAIGAGATQKIINLYQPLVPIMSLLILRRAWIQIISASVATNIDIQLYTTAVAPTGGVAAARLGFSPIGGAPDALCMSLPTGGAGAIGNSNGFTMNLGVTGAAPVLNPPPLVGIYELYANRGTFTPDPAIGSVVNSRGWGIQIFSTAASTIVCSAGFEWSEAA